MEPQYTEITEKDVDLSTKLNENISLKTSLLTRTKDPDEAVAAARQGSIGVIDKMNINQQIQAVTKVKMAQNIFIKNPYAIAPTETAQFAKETMNSRSIGSLLILNNSKLFGIITQRDLRFARSDELVHNLCTPVHKMILASPEISKNEAVETFRRFKIKYLPIVKDEEILGLVCAGDLAKTMMFPDISVNSKGHLLVGAIIDSISVDKAETLVNAGVDLLWIEDKYGYSKQCIEAIEKVKEQFPHIFLIAGNVGSGEGVETLIKKGADLVSFDFDTYKLNDVSCTLAVGKDNIKALFSGSRIITVNSVDKIQEYTQKIKEMCVLSNTRSLQKN